MAGNTSTVHSGKVHNMHCVSSAGTGFPTQLQICRCRLPSYHPVLRLVCYPFFLTASESRLQFYCSKMYLLWPSYTHVLYFTEIASYIHSSEAGCILMYICPSTVMMNACHWLQIYLWSNTTNKPAYPKLCLQLCLMDHNTSQASARNAVQHQGHHWAISVGFQLD